MKDPAFDRRAHPEDAIFSDWRAPDGWMHRRLDWPQPAGSERGTLLFAGGRGDFIEKYLEPLAHWHERGWRVASFDWRGQGASRGGLDGDPPGGLDPLVDDLAALFAELRAAGPGPNVAIGHSMGGHVLLRALAEERLRADAAVLVSPMLAINSGPMPSWAAWSAASLASAFGWGSQPLWRTPVPAPPGSSRQSILTACPERYADELWWWERQPGFNLGAPSWGWLEAAYRSCARLDEAGLRKVGVPLLLLGTETDRLVSAAAIRRAASLLPNARLKMFERAGHEILREAEPVRSEALAAIDAFLDEAAPQ